jgi:hypothetical protein
MPSHPSVAAVAALAIVALSAPAARAQFATSQTGPFPGKGPFSVAVLSGPQAKSLDLGAAASATFQIQPLPAGSPAYRAPSGTAVVQFATDNQAVAMYGARSCLAQGSCARVTIVQVTPQTTTTYIMDGVQVTQYQMGTAPVQVTLAFRAYQWQSQPTPHQQHDGTLGNGTPTFSVQPMQKAN